MGVTKSIYNPKKIYQYWLKPLSILFVVLEDFRLGAKIYRSALRHGRFLATMRRSVLTTYTHFYRQLTTLKRHDVLSTSTKKSDQWYRNMKV